MRTCKKIGWILKSMSLNICLKTNKKARIITFADLITKDDKFSFLRTEPTCESKNMAELSFDNKIEVVQQPREDQTKNRLELGIIKL